MHPTERTLSKRMAHKVARGWDGLVMWSSVRFSVMLEGFVYTVCNPA